MDRRLAPQADLLSILRSARARQRPRRLNHRVRFPRRYLLLRHCGQRRERCDCHHRGRCSPKFSRKTDRVLDRKRYLPPVTGMRFSQAGTQSLRERRRLRRRMAIRSISQAAGRRGRLSRELQPRRELLSARIRSCPALACGPEHGAQRRSLVGKNPITFLSRGNIYINAILKDELE